MDAKIKELLTRLSFFAEDGMADKPIVEIAKQADALLTDLVKQQNTQQPVAWRYIRRADGKVVHDTIEMVKWTDDQVSYVAKCYDVDVVPLYTAPPVPRDALMALAEDVRDAVDAAYSPRDDRDMVDLAAIADRYASKVQPEPVAWSMSKNSILELAAELVRGAECMADDETELTLEVRIAGTVQDDDGSMNAGPVLAIFDAEYPEEGCYPIDPENPTAGRATEPATHPEPVNQQLLAALKDARDIIETISENASSRSDRAYAARMLRTGNHIDSAIAAAEAAQPVDAAYPCWSCKKPVTIAQRGDADGNCPHCHAELDGEDWPTQQPASAQPVAVPDEWRAELSNCVGPINIALATISMHQGAESAEGAAEQCQRALVWINTMLSAAQKAQP